MQLAGYWTIIAVIRSPFTFVVVEVFDYWNQPFSAAIVNPSYLFHHSIVIISAFNFIG